MSRPEIISILGQEVRIVYTADDPHATELGSFDSASMTITILDREGVWERTLLHEIIHCILSVTGATHLLEENTEECIVTSLEYGLFSHYKRDF